MDHGLVIQEGSVADLRTKCSIDMELSLKVEQNVAEQVLQRLNG